MNPECHRVRAQYLEQFAAGKPAADTLDIEDAAQGAHLSACDACQAEIERWQRTAAAVRRWRVATNPELRDRTVLRLRLRSEKLRQRRQAYQFLAAACAVSAAVNAASFRLIWDAAGFLRAWLGWPAVSQPALLAAWTASPLIVVALVLWLVHANPVDGAFAQEDSRHD